MCERLLAEKAFGNRGVQKILRLSFDPELPRLPRRIIKPTRFYILASKNVGCLTGLDNLADFCLYFPVSFIEKAMDDSAWMKEAICEAKKALPADVPVGAVVVIGGAIVGRGHNMVEALSNPTRHAEVVAIEEASRAVGRVNLALATMFVTLEPCPMCAGAIVMARLGRLVFGASDPRQGAVRSLYTILSDARLGHQVAVEAGVLEDECRSLLQDFFRSLRRKER